MNQQVSRTRWFRAMAAWAVAGTVLATSCSSEQIQAVVAGLDAVANTIADNNASDNTSLTDLILNEFKK